MLVTGASSGIGRATARLLAREGSDVALLARDREALECVADVVRAAGAEAHVVLADVGDRSALREAVDASAAALGGLDGVVVNAAAAGYGRFEDIRAADFDRTIAVALTGAIDTIRLALPHLRGSHGAIVVTGSIVATVPAPLFSPYATAKSGLRGFARTLRSELRADGAGVDLSLVQPGVVSTPFWDTVTSASGRAARRPPGGYSPEPVARTIVDCLVRPRAEVTVGGAAVTQVAAYAAVRPLLDLVFPLGVRWIESGGAPAHFPGSLWSPPEGARPEGGGRLSVLELARRALRLGP